MEMGSCDERRGLKAVGNLVQVSPFRGESGLEEEAISGGGTRTVLSKVHIKLEIETAGRTGSFSTTDKAVDLIRERKSGRMI